MQGRMGRRAALRNCDVCERTTTAPKLLDHE